MNFLLRWLRNWGASIKEGWQEAKDFWEEGGPLVRFVWWCILLELCIIVIKVNAH